MLKHIEKKTYTKYDVFRATLKIPNIWVHTGQGKLEKVREFEWSGKVRKSQGKCKRDWKVREI